MSATDMRAQLLIVLVLVVLFFIGTNDHDTRVDASTELLARGNEDVLEYDINQRTCALEVVLVFRDIEDPRTIDRTHDTAPIPLEVRPNGTMLACMPPPIGQVERPE